MSGRPINILVIGATGYAGSHICIELLARGHLVTGLTRSPEKIGSHPRYTPRSIDLEKTSIEGLIDAFTDHDVIINTYGPHTAGELLPYMPYIEVTRKIVLAMKHLKTPYLITVGGAGSLAIPGKPFLTALDSEDFWIAYFQHAADSAAYRAYAEARFPKFATLLQRYHDIREFHERDEEDMQFMKEMAAFTKSRTTESHFIMACRASLLFYEGNMDFNWTFLSPSPGLKPGPKTAKYVSGDAVLPIDGPPTPPYEGRLLGITVKDLAMAIADEVETKKMARKHWTVWTPREFAVDIPLKDVYGSLSELESA